MCPQLPPERTWETSTQRPECCAQSNLKPTPNSRLSNTSCAAIAHIIGVMQPPSVIVPEQADMFELYVDTKHSVRDQIAACASLFASLSSAPQVSCGRSCFLDDCLQQGGSASDSVKPNRDVKSRSALSARVVTVHLLIVCSFILLFAPLGSFRC